MMANVVHCKLRYGGSDIEAVDVTFVDREGVRTGICDRPPGDHAFGSEGWDLEPSNGHHVPIVITEVLTDKIEFVASHPK
jgi:hypothetical protein